MRYEPTLTRLNANRLSVVAPPGAEAPVSAAVMERRAAAMVARFRMHDEAARFAAIYRADGSGGYGRLAPPAESHLAGLLARHGAEGFADVMAQTMLIGIAAFWSARPDRPPAVLKEARRWHDRIEREVRDGRLDDWQHSGDILRKDLAAVFGRAWPVEAWVVTRTRPRLRFVMRGSIGNRLRAAAFAAVHLRGGGDWLTANYHPAERERFSAAGFHRLGQRLADLLEADPALRGVYLAPSWLNDPRLGEVSPHLGFRRSWIPHGAQGFFLKREGAECWGLKTSATRRAAFEDGRYRPERHAIFWPRADVLRWANHPMVR